MLHSLGGKVDVNNLNTVLGNMGVKLSNMELRDLNQSIHVGGEHLTDIKHQSPFVSL